VIGWFTWDQIYAPNNFELFLEGLGSIFRLFIFILTVNYFSSITFVNITML
jgi:hypothetical protein